MENNDPYGGIIKDAVAGKVKTLLSKQQAEDMTKSLFMGFQKMDL